MSVGPAVPNAANESLGQLKVAANSASAYLHDVFVSCHANDEDWVTQDLINPLQAAGVRITGEWAFRVGANVVVERDLAIQNSRHTLVVLTPDWCANPFTQNDALQARFLDPSAADRKILPLMGKACQPPAPIASTLALLNVADFTEFSVRQVTVKKLLEEFGRPRQEINEAMSQFARQGIRALIELMKSPTVREDVRRFELAFSGAHEEIDELRSCKAVHEALHRVDAEMQGIEQPKEELRQWIESHNGELSPDELDEAWSNLDRYLSNTIPANIESLGADARAEELRPEQLTRIEVIERSFRELIAAYEGKDLRKLCRRLATLAKQIEEELNRYNHELHEAARRLRLSTLVKSLVSVKEAAKQVAPAPDVAQRLHEFSQGIAALAELELRVQEMVTNHDFLQDIDGILRTLTYPCTEEDDVEKLTEAWPDIQLYLDKLVLSNGTPWGNTLRSAQADIQAILAKVDLSALDEKSLRVISQKLGRLLSAVNTAFTQVDKGLFRLSHMLKEVGTGLQDTIGNLHHD